MPEDQVKVLSAWPSPFGMRVLIALEEKGIPYQYQEENVLNKSQLLLDSNPVHKKVPVLIHNDKPVCESLNIVQYVDDMWASEDNSFLPKEPSERAAARFWADYIDKKLAEAASAIIRNPPGEPLEQAKAALSESLATLDRALQEAGSGKPFNGGNGIGLVGIALVPLTCWFHALEVVGDFKLPDEKACPTLYSWIKVLLDKPSVQKCLPDPAKILEYTKNVRMRLNII